MMKAILFVSLLFTILCGVSGADFCAGKPSGDYCMTDRAYFASCPNSAARACQAGLVCKAIEEGKPGVFCVRPEEAGVTAAPVKPTTAPVKPTTKPEELPECEDEDEPNPEDLPECEDEDEPTTAPTPTRTPPTGTTTRPTNPPVVTVAPTVAPTRAPSPSLPPASGTWPAPGVPVRAIYIDNYCYSPDFSFKTLVKDGYNLIILAFFVSGVKWDCVGVWDQMTQDAQKDVIKFAHDNGARIIVVVGGATDYAPYEKFKTGASYARPVAEWVKANNLDGMDFDLENFAVDFKYGNMDFDATVQWVADATNTAREVMGANAIITHAPQPPYFGQHGWNDGYTKVYEKSPHINFFLVQFYNNGQQTTYETIFTTGNGGQWSTVKSISNNGKIPMSKIVVGKPVHSQDLNSNYGEAVRAGYTTPQELNAMFKRAKEELGWNTGVMGWQWINRDDKTWVKTIYPDTPLLN